MLVMPNRSSLAWQSRPQSSWRRRLFALGPLLVGSTALLGWTIGVPALTSVLPGLVSMVPNTALSFMAISVGLLLLPAGVEPARPASRKSVAAFAALPVIIGMLTLAEYAAGISFGVDELLFADPNIASNFPGRPAPATAVSVSFAGAALLLLVRAATRLDGAGWRSVMAAHLLALVPASVGYLGLAGYLFDVGSLYSFGPFKTVALNTGIASGLTALAILYTEPEAGWRRFFAAVPAAAKLFERRLIVALSVPLVIGTLIVWGARFGMYNSLFASSLFAFVAAAGSSALTWRLTGSKAKLAEFALREGEERFRGIFEHAATGIAIMDLNGRLQSCNSAFSAMLGHTEQELRELACQDLLHPEDRSACKVQQDRLLAGEIPSFQIVSRYYNKEGDILWGDRHISLLRDAANRPTNIMMLVTDITERKRHEDQISLLISEVNHRAKNMLAVVQGIARQTVAANPGDFIERFSERIRSLAASQDLLVKNEWKGVDLHELARSQLGHFKDLIDIRIELRGPPLFVSASAAQAIGMALHELATNAGKYGALSDDSGSVEVCWSLKPGKGSGEAFVISWRERGGPAMVAPGRAGFGSTVLYRVAKESLDAQVELDYASTGLVWLLQCPAGEVMDTSRPT